MPARSIPNLFARLLSDGCIDGPDILSTTDGFFVVNQSVSGLLASKDIWDFPDSSGQKLPCSKFFDDWYLYAVPGIGGHTYSLLKLREQEHDAEDGSPADGDTPGVTISFIAFDCQILLDCLAAGTDESRSKLNREINRVVAHRGQCHHPALKAYFIDPKSQGAYLVADLYTRYIASLAENGRLAVPEYYKKLVQQSISYKSSRKLSRLPRFIDALNREAGHTICDQEVIYLANREAPTKLEAAAILATHTGNTSIYSFAAEVEYHAKFLTPLAKLKIPFFGRSIYDSAIRADMTVQDTEFEGPAPFHSNDSKLVKRHIALHQAECDSVK